MTKPKFERAKILALLAQHNIDLAKEQVVLIGMRAGKNKIGVFDDSFCWITPDLCEGFNGNCDPSTEQQGRANLKAGLWRYQMGMHNGTHLPPYEAFRQAAPVTVMRWDEKKGTASIPDTGMFGINIHHGGSGTSSLGCQTVPMEQWPEFKNLGYKLLQKAGKKDFAYLLVDSL